MLQMISDHNDSKQSSYNFSNLQIYNLRKQSIQITVQNFMFEKYLLELSASNIMVNKKHTSNDAQHLTIE